MEFCHFTFRLPLHDFCNFCLRNTCTAFALEGQQKTRSVAVLFWCLFCETPLLFRHKCTTKLLAIFCTTTEKTRAKCNKKATPLRSFCDIATKKTKNGSCKKPVFECLFCCLPKTCYSSTSAKQLPPINSRSNELQGTNLSSISLKYFKNFIRRLAVM